MHEKLNLSFWTDSGELCAFCIKRAQKEAKRRQTHLVCLCAQSCFPGVKVVSSFEWNNLELILPHCCNTVEFSLQNRINKNLQQYQAASLRNPPPPAMFLSITNCGMNKVNCSLQQPVCDRRPRRQPGFSFFCVFLCARLCARAESSCY